MKLITRILAARRVNAWLAPRPALSFDDWHKSLGCTEDSAERASMFVFTRFAQYSGLYFPKVQPSDRMMEDLRFDEVTFGDWDLDLCEDFYAEFRSQLHLPAGADDPLTVADWVRYLTRQARG